MCKCHSLRQNGMLHPTGLPKTRSGKIMRRILRKIAERKDDDLGVPFCPSLWLLKCIHSLLVLSAALHDLRGRHMPPAIELTT